MIFITISLLMISLFALIKGNAIRRFLYKAVTEEVKNDEQKLKNEISIFAYFFFSLVYLLVFIAYLSVAVKIDPFKFPTFIMMAWLIIGFIADLIKGSKNIDDRRHITKKVRKRTVFMVLTNMLRIAYFTFMLIILTI